MSWLAQKEKGDFDSLFALRPNLYQDYRKFAELFWQKQLLPARILEFCRLRVAGLHGCEAELMRRYRAPAAPAEEELTALGGWHGECRFSGLEKACLEIAELFAMDPHAIPDAPVALVREELGDAAVVALMEWLAICDGFCRFQLLLQAEVPPALQYLEVEGCN